MKHEHIHLIIPEGQKENLRRLADLNGTSVNRFLNDLIRERLYQSYPEYVSGKTYIPLVKQD